MSFDRQNKDLQSLLSKGWEIHEHVWVNGHKTETLAHPKLCPIERGGGYTDISYALNNQAEADAREANRNYYYITKNQMGRGYGFNITELRPDKSRHLVLNVATKKMADTYLEILNEKGKCEIEFLLNTTQYPYLMILEEKHGHRYFHVPTLEVLIKTCRAIIMERVENDWYCDLKDDAAGDMPEFPREEVEKWKDGPVKRAALDQWDSYDREKEYRDGNKAQIEAVKFIKENDNIKGCLKAYTLLTSRKNYEYESIVFDAFETIE